jgi:hypothetical protein
LIGRFEPAGAVFSFNETSPRYPRPVKHVEAKQEDVYSRDRVLERRILFSDFYVYASPPSPPRVAALEPHTRLADSPPARDDTLS